MNRNSPRASVTCVCEPVLPVRVMVTPGRTPPCSSVMRPTIVPVSVWAPASGTTDRSAASRRSEIPNRFILVPPLLTLPGDRVNPVVLQGIGRVADARRQGGEHRDADR